MPQRTAVISITRHGIAQAGRVVAVLPGAQLFALAKKAAARRRERASETTQSM